MISYSFNMKSFRAVLNVYIGIAILLIVLIILTVIMTLLIVI